MQESAGNAELVVAAVRAGDLVGLATVLSAEPELARIAMPGHRGRTLLHIATDWPGFWPAGPQVVELLLSHGADPNQRGGPGQDGETPLHWAASSDDVDVARVLLAGGADPEAADGSIGTPLDNAIGYGCYRVAELLAARGARVDTLWHAAALGQLDRLEVLLAADPDQDELSQAFWHACAAARRRAAERLLDAGADLNWIPDYAEGTALNAADQHPTQRQNVIDWLRERGAVEAQEPG